MSLLNLASASSGRCMRKSPIAKIVKPAKHSETGQISQEPAAEMRPTNSQSHWVDLLWTTFSYDPSLSATLCFNVVSSVSSSCMHDASAIRAGSPRAPADVVGDCQSPHLEISAESADLEGSNMMCDKQCMYGGRRQKFCTFQDSCGGAKIG